jgi:hypothetical protein
MGTKEDKSGPVRLLIKTQIVSSTLLEEKFLAPRRGYRLIDDAIDPRDGKPWQLRVSEDKIKLIAQRSCGQAKELAYVVPEVLRIPSCIFQGVREEGEKDWLCYCGVPSHAYKKNGDRVEAWEGEVYLVFVSADRVVYNFRWEACDSEKQCFPKDYAKRFYKWVL